MHWSDDTRSRFFGACQSKLWYIDALAQDLILKPLVVVDDSSKRAVEFNLIGGLEAKDETDMRRIWVSDVRDCTISGISQGRLKILIGRPNESGREDGEFKKAKFVSPTSVVNVPALNALFVVDSQYIRVINFTRWTVATLSGKPEGPKSISTSFLPSFTTSSLYAPPILHSHPEDGTVYLNLDRETYSLRTFYESRNRSRIGVLSRLNIAASTAICDYDGDNLLIQRDYDFLSVPISTGSEKMLVKSTKVSTAPHPLYYAIHLNASLHLRGRGSGNPKLVFCHHHRATKAPRRTSFFALVSLLTASNVPCSHIITKENSERTWRVHLDVIRGHPSTFSPERTLKKLISTIQLSRLPDTSVDAFFKFLYFHPISTADPSSTCLVLSHIIHFAREIGLKTDWPEFLFGSTLMPLLSVQSICQLLFTLWQDIYVTWTVEDPIIQFLVGAIRKQAKDAFLEQAPLMLTRCTPERLTSITNAVSGSNARRSSPPTFDDRSRLPTLPVIPIREVFDYKIRGKSVQEDYCLIKDETSGVDPLEFLDDEAEFAIAAENSNVWLVSQTWLLYTQWPLFRTEFNENTELSEKRFWKAPSWINHNILVCIVESVHGDVSSFSSLSIKDCRMILEHLVSQGLSEPHTGAGIGCWKKLASVCQFVIRGPNSSSTASQTSAPTSTTSSVVLTYKDSVHSGNPPVGTLNASSSSVAGIYRPFAPVGPNNKPAPVPPPRPRKPASLIKALGDRSSLPTPLPHPSSMHSPSLPSITTASGSLTETRARPLPPTPPLAGAIAVLPHRPSSVASPPLLSSDSVNINTVSPPPTSAASIATVSPPPVSYSSTSMIVTVVPPPIVSPPNTSAVPAVGAVSSSVATRSEIPTGVPSLAPATSFSSSSSLSMTSGIIHVPDSTPPPIFRPLPPPPSAVNTFAPLPANSADAAHTAGNTDAPAYTSASTIHTVASGSADSNHENNWSKPSRSRVPVTERSQSIYQVITEIQPSSPFSLSSSSANGKEHSPSNENGLRHRLPIETSAPPPIMRHQLQQQNQHGHLRVNTAPSAPSSPRGLDSAVSPPPPEILYDDDFVIPADGLNNCVILTHFTAADPEPSPIKESSPSFVEHSNSSSISVSPPPPCVALSINALEPGGIMPTPTASIKSKIIKDSLPKPPELFSYQSTKDRYYSIKNTFLIVHCLIVNTNPLIYFFLTLLF